MKHEIVIELESYTRKEFLDMAYYTSVSPSVKNNELVGQEKISQYLSGGHGVVTLVSPSGKSYSYKFRYPREEQTFIDGTMFVYSREGNKKWLYVGMFVSGIFRSTAMSEFSRSSEVFKGAKYVVRMATDKDLKTPMKLYHEGYCCVCGRRLTSVKTMSEGVGPKCKRRMKEYGIF